jgi:hypothetical protein
MLLVAFLAPSTRGGNGFIRPALHQPGQQRVALFGCGSPAARKVFGAMFKIQPR